MKRAFLLSLDALVAVSLLLMLTAFLSSISLSYSSPELEYQRFYYAGKDVMNDLEIAKLSAVMEFMTNNFTGDCNITEEDMEKTILDVLGYLWAQNSTVLNECAENLTREIFNRTLPSSYGYEVLIDDISIYKHGSPTNYLSRLSTIVSGYELGKPVSGYFGSAYISRMAKNTSAYVYFGGYEGDGNITKTANLPADANITSVYMEMSIGNNFTLWVNGKNEGYYSPTMYNMSADNWTVCTDTASCGNFTTGENTIEIKFDSGEYNFVGGGFIRIEHNTYKPNTLPFTFSNETATKQYLFPGIDGIVNLYSSFYVPGNLESLYVKLHLESNYTLFLNIGNTTVYENYTDGEEEINLTNSTLYGMLSYEAISNKTIPLRLSLRNVSYIPVVQHNNTDVMLTTDTSQSMQECIEYNCTYNCFMGDSKSCIVYNESDCVGNVCGGTCDSPGGHSTVCYNTKLDLAKTADKEFVDFILNISGNRVGLVGYYSTTPVSQQHDLSNDSVSLYATIDGYGTASADHACMSCAIGVSRDKLLAQSGDDRLKFIVLMSDGRATKCWPSKECPDAEAAEEAINFSCDAYNLYNITVYAVAYGNDADTQTLQDIADCGHGKYYFSNATDLLNVYRALADDILAKYFMQTIKVYGNTSLESTLFSDSYIEFNYTPNDYLRYGEVSLSMQSNKFEGNLTSPKNGIFYIPAGCRILDTKVTSYSSSYWTSSLILNTSKTGGWKTIFNLTDYGGNYTELGDPYIIYIPVNLLETGKNNTVGIDTGFSPENMTGGSPDDRAIFHVGVTGIVGYGDVFHTLENATDDAIQRLQNQLSEFNITLLEVKTASQYISELPSLWGPSVMEIRVWT
jgi:hypothetical protein